MKKNTFEKIVKFINFSLKVDSNSTSTTLMYQPVPPKAINQFKKNDK